MIRLTAYTGPFEIEFLEMAPFVTALFENTPFRTGRFAYLCLIRKWLLRKSNVIFFWYYVHDDLMIFKVYSNT